MFLLFLSSIIIFFIVFKHPPNIHHPSTLSTTQNHHQPITHHQLPKIINNHPQEEEDLFNADYTEVDRVLDVAESVGEGGGVVRHYLVTWRSLPYEEATWELEKDVDKVRVVVEWTVGGGNGS